MSVILNVVNYFWKLGFNEEAPDIYEKPYRDGYRVRVDMAAEAIDYGGQVQVVDGTLKRFSQRNFVVCVAYGGSQ